MRTGCIAIPLGLFVVPVQISRGDNLLYVRVVGVDLWTGFQQTPRLLFATLESN